MCKLTFLKDVLAKRKILLKVSEITGIPQVPRVNEINSATIWEDIKTEEKIKQYFLSHTLRVNAFLIELLCLHSHLFYLLTCL